MGSAHMLCHSTVCHVIIPLHRDRASTNNLDLSSQLTPTDGEETGGKIISLGKRWLSEWNNGAQDWKETGLKKMEGRKD